MNTPILYLSGLRGHTVAGSMRAILEVRDRVFPVTGWHSQNAVPAHRMRWVRTSQVGGYWTTG